MRIHRQCHRCHTTFGSSKTCVGCEHTRCTKCPRYPPKKTSDKKGKEPAVPGTGVIEADNYWGLRDVIELRKPNPRPGGQPLVRKKPMQRVRRTCHECQTMFTASAKICANCQHVRCADCPRDPYVFPLPPFLFLFLGETSLVVLTYPPEQKRKNTPTATQATHPVLTRPSQ